MTIEPTFAPPTEDEMALRLARVRELMEARGLTHYVAACPDNVFYLTNFANYVHERPFILVVPMTGEMRFLVPKLEVPHVRARSVGSLDLVEYFEFPAPVGEAWTDKFQSIFPDGARVGVESTCPLQVYEAVPGSRVRDDAVEDVRAIKTEYEVARIVYSSNLATQGMDILLGMAAPGVGLMEVNPKVRGHMLMTALIDNPNTNMLATNATSIFQSPGVSHDPHNFTDVSMKMEEGGPHVALINGTINGYGTEVERTFFLGSVPEAAKKPFDVMMDVRAKAFEMCVPGTVMNDLDVACNDIFKGAGYAGNLLHRTGHSIGVTGHEGPFLAEGDDRVIAPGMVFTIEPGVYIKGVGGFRHSDTVLVTEGGNLSLTPNEESMDGLTLALD